MEDEENYIKRQRFYKTIMLVVLTAFLTVIFTTIYMTRKYNINNDNQTISSLFGGSSSDDNIPSMAPSISLLSSTFL